MSIARARAQLAVADAPGDAAAQAGAEGPSAARRDKKLKAFEPTPDFAASLARDDLQEWNVDDRLAQCLVSDVGIERFFPLQQRALELLIGNPYSDACISARTGSGKTLMYAIPLVQSLSSRVVVRLRALVILPSRDLAEQVFQVINVLASSVGLAVQCTAGMHSVRAEMDLLYSDYRDENAKVKRESKVDVLVATPGRLVDHIERGLDLQHLQLLVVDEADRLLSQAYHDWLERVYAAAHRQIPSVVQVTADRVSIVETTSRRRGVGEEHAGLAVMDDARDAPRLRRILCSATLTKNPQKLAALALDRPLLVSEDEEESALPRGLEERAYWVSRTGKPAMLLYLLQQVLHKGRVLVFASSVERAERVHDMLVATSASCALISSMQSIKERTRVLDAFRRGEVKILVASDVAARGIDVENLECVLSYDVPQKAKTYVHRAGRTARAARQGLSVVLCRKDQARHFREIKRKLGAAPPVFSKVAKEELVELRATVKRFTEGDALVRDDDDALPAGSNATRKESDDDDAEESRDDDDSDVDGAQEVS